MVATDYNDDGYKDLLMFWYEPEAKLFWNRKGEFKSSDYTSFPTVGDDGVVDEFGNLWDRSNREQFQSRIHDTAQSRIQAYDVPPGVCVVAYGSLPKKMNLAILVRGSFDGVKWTEWESPSGDVPEGAIAGGQISAKGRYFQYRLIAGLNYAGTSQFRVDSVKSFVVADGSGPRPATDRSTEASTYAKSLAQIRIENGAARVSLSSAGRLQVSDISGRQVLSTALSPGVHVVALDAARGVYVVRLTSEGKTQVQKVVLDK